MLCQQLVLFILLFLFLHIFIFMFISISLFFLLPLLFFIFSTTDLRQNNLCNYLARLFLTILSKQLSNTCEMYLASHEHFTSIWQLFIFFINLSHERKVGNPSAIEGQTVNIKNLRTGLLGGMLNEVAFEFFKVSEESLGRGETPRLFWVIFFVRLS